MAGGSIFRSSSGSSTSSGRSTSSTGSQRSPSSRTFTRRVALPRITNLPSVPYDLKSPANPHWNSFLTEVAKQTSRDLADLKANAVNDPSIAVMWDVYVQTLSDGAALPSMTGGRGGGSGGGGSSGGAGMGLMDGGAQMDGGMGSFSSQPSVHSSWFRSFFIDPADKAAGKDMFNSFMQVDSPPPAHSHASTRASGSSGPAAKTQHGSSPSSDLRLMQRMFSQFGNPSSSQQKAQAQHDHHPPRGQQQQREQQQKQPAKPPQSQQYQQQQRQQQQYQYQRQQQQQQQQRQHEQQQPRRYKQHPLLQLYQKRAQGDYNHQQPQQQDQHQQQRYQQQYPYQQPQQYQQNRYRQPHQQYRYQQQHQQQYQQQHRYYQPKHQQQQQQRHQQQHGYQQPNQHHRQQQWHQHNRHPQGQQQGPKKPRHSKPDSRTQSQGSSLSLDLVRKLSDMLSPQLIQSLLSPASFHPRISQAPPASRRHLVSHTTSNSQRQSYPWSRSPYGSSSSPGGPPGVGPRWRQPSAPRRYRRHASSALKPLPYEGPERSLMAQ